MTGNQLSSCLTRVKVVILSHLVDTVHNLTNEELLVQVTDYKHPNANERCPLATDITIEGKQILDLSCISVVLLITPNEDSSHYSTFDVQYAIILIKVLDLG